MNLEENEFNDIIDENNEENNEEFDIKTTRFTTLICNTHPEVYLYCKSLYKICIMKTIRKILY